MPTLTNTPVEIIANPLQLYFAPIGTAYPAVDATQSQITTGGWSLVGTNGNLDHDSAGATVTHNQTLATFQSAGSTGPSKVWRTSEQLEISITLADTSAAYYALVLNDVAVTTISATTGVAGEQDLSLLMGVNVTCFAMIAVGVSPLVTNSYQAMYCLPAVYQSANPAPNYKMGTPAELALTFSTLIDPNGGGFGLLRQQNAAKI